MGTLAGFVESALTSDEVVTKERCQMYYISCQRCCHHQVSNCCYHNYAFLRFNTKPLTSTVRYMDAFREGATGATVLQKTKEMKKSHRVPLVLDQLSKGGYDRSRRRRLLSEVVGKENEAGEGEEIVFDQESFAEKITQLGYPNNPRRRFARMGRLFRTQTKEAPRMA